MCASLLEKECLFQCLSLLQGWELREGEDCFFNGFYSFHPSLLSLYIKRSAPKGPIRTAKERYWAHENMKTSFKIIPCQERVCVCACVCVWFDVEHEMMKTILKPGIQYILTLPHTVYIFTGSVIYIFNKSVHLRSSVSVWSLEVANQTHVQAFY